MLLRVITRPIRRVGRLLVFVFKKVRSKIVLERLQRYPKVITAAHAVE